MYVKNVAGTMLSLKYVFSDFHYFECKNNYCLNNNIIFLLLITQHVNYELKLMLHETIVAFKSRSQMMIEGKLNV